MELTHLISRLLFPLHVLSLWVAGDPYEGCARGGRALPRPQLPCDLVANSFCDTGGDEYPWHQMRKWVFENQGLIKRMYGNTKHYSVLREELDSGHTDQPYQMYSPEFQGSHNHNVDNLQGNHNLDKVDNHNHGNKVRDSVRSHAFARNDEGDFVNRNNLDGDFVNRNNLLDDVPQPRETRMRKQDARFGARSLSIDETRSRNKIRKTDRFLDKGLRQKLNHEKKGGVSITKSYSSPSTTTNKTRNVTVTDDDYPEVTTAAYSDLAESLEAEAPDSPPEVSPDVMKSVADSLVDLQEEEVSAVTENSDVETTTFDQDWTIITQSQDDDITSTTESLLITTETPVGESTTDYEGLSTFDSIVTDATTEDSTVSAITAEDLSVESRTSVGFEIELEAELSNSGMSFKFPEEDTKAFPEDYASETLPREEEFETVRDILDEIKNTDEQTNVDAANVVEQTTEKIVDETDAHSIAHSTTRNPPILIRKKHFKRRTNEGKINTSDKNSELGITSRKPPGRGQAFYRRPSQIATPAPLEAPSPSTVPPPPIHPDPPRGVNACPVTEDVVAPYWANNTRGVVLALLNIKPFEQYVHWEKCRYQYRQMNCRHNCRCEQQYRLHRMLAFDPQDDCKGVFSDWFRFPSGCVCKCYDLPSTAQVRYVTDYSRRPRKDALDSVRVAPEGRSSQGRSPPESDREERLKDTDDLSEVYFMDEEELEIPDVSNEIQSMDSEAQGSSNSIQISVGKDSHVYKMKEEINVPNTPQFASNAVQRKKYRHYGINGEESSTNSFASHRNDKNNEKGPTVAIREILPNNLMTTQPQRYNLRFVNPQRLLPPSSPSLLSHIKRIHFMNSGYRPNMNRRVYRPNKHRMRSMKSLSNWNPQGSFPPSLSNPKFKKYSNRMPKTYTVTKSMRDEGKDGSNNLNFQNLIRHPDMNGVSQEHKNEVYDSLSNDNDQYFFNLTSHLLRSRQLELQ